MSSLDTLIKLHRWQLDEQRRKVVEFENLAERLRAELQRTSRDRNTASTASLLSVECVLDPQRRDVSRTAREPVTNTP